MRFILVTLTAFSFTLFLSAPSEVDAHSGGLNSKGCHAGSKPYHCHRSSSEMKGNRLRCDLGSKSAECKQKNDKPQDRNNVPSTDNNQTGNASAISATLPDYLIGGYGLVCTNSAESGYHWVLSKQKDKMAYYMFNSDKVVFDWYAVRGTTDKYLWGPLSNFTLNRQTLTLTVKEWHLNGDFDCEIIPAIEMLDIAEKRLKEELSKNKL